MDARFFASRLLLGLALPSAAAAVLGCTTPLPPIERDAGGVRDAGRDASADDAGSAPDASAMDAQADDASLADAALDGGATDAGPLDAGPPDAGPPPCLRGSPFSAPVLVSSLSDPAFDDDGLTVSRDEDEAIVRSGVEDAFYRHPSPSVTAPYAAGAPLGINPVNRDQGPFLATGGLELLFASSRDTGAGGIELLYRSVRTSPGGAFGAPSRLTLPPMGSPTDLNDPYQVGTSVYFSGVGPSRARGIFVAPRTGPGDTLGTPMLLTELDQGNDDFSPVVSEDGLEIFFARDGAGGGDDIVMSTRTSTSLPFAPASVAIALRTGQNEQPEALSADGCRLYLVSNRSGRWDAYVASRTPP